MKFYLCNTFVIIVPDDLQDSCTGNFFRFGFGRAVGGSRMRNTKENGLPGFMPGRPEKTDAEVCIFRFYAALSS